MDMQSLTVVKIGGKVLEDDRQLSSALADFAAVEGPKILVHGGGKRSDELCLQLGIEPKMVEGRRITDAPTLEIVTMVYAGLLNKKVTGLLQSVGCNAIGLSGADGNAILAHKRAKGQIDYGFAGDIDEVNSGMLAALLNTGLVPVLCSITHDGKGQLLNTNADTIATVTAAAMAANYRVTLKFCFEKAGVLRDPADDAAVIPMLNQADYARFREEGVINAGMIPKIDNALAAKRGGVNKVLICGVKAISPAATQNGTEICL
ncbi:MAG: acetylglutamate kinase [Lewinella sp.]|nr:acetylglutamate kinase [Lewinella sp.]